MRIDKLQDAAQFTSWKFQVRIALNAREIYGVVSGTEVKPEAAATTAGATAITAANTAITDWNNKDARAQNIIVSTLGDRAIAHVMDCATASAMWQKLITIYEQTNEFSKSQLQQQFFSFAKEPADDMATFISKMDVLVHRMRNATVAIEDSMIITRLITALPQEYRHFVSAWDSVVETSKTLENLKGRLMIEEQRMKTGESIGQDVAFVAHRGSNQKRGKCYSCGRKGHYKNECPDKSSKEAKTFFAKSDVAFICVDVHDKDDIEAFVLDSAASKHLCNKREWFNDYVELKQPREITVGNGEKIYAIGRGNIGIKSFNGENWIDATMHGVLYVPKLHRNLFSSLQATDMGCDIRSNKKTCELVKDGNIVAVGVRNRNLYCMQFKVKQPEKPRQFAIIEIENKHLVVERETTTLSENDAPNSIVSESIEKAAVQTDDASTSSTYTTASERKESDEEESASEHKESDEEESLSEHTDKLEQSVLQPQQKPAKRTDRRLSTVCDVMPENMIDKRLRGAKNMGEANDRNDDTAFVAIVEEPKKKKKRNRHKRTSITENHK